jgi:hypothetical protein
MRPIHGTRQTQECCTDLTFPPARDPTPGWLPLPFSIFTWSLATRYPFRTGESWNRAVMVGLQNGNETRVALNLLVTLTFLNFQR